MAKKSKSVELEMDGHFICNGCNGSLIPGSPKKNSKQTRCAQALMGVDSHAEPHFAWKREAMPVEVLSEAGRADVKEEAQRLAASETELDCSSGK